MLLASFRQRLFSACPRQRFLDVLNLDWTLYFLRVKQLNPSGRGSGSTAPLSHF